MGFNNREETKKSRHQDNKEKVFGIAIFNGSEWISALPTEVGEVFYWYKNYDDEGNEIDFLMNRAYD